MESTDDARRHTIYFRINDEDPVSLGGLTTLEYTQFKRNDKEAYRGILKLIDSGRLVISEKEIRVLCRSIDDVDYTPVEIPCRQPSNTEISNDKEQLDMTSQQTQEVSTRAVVTTPWTIATRTKTSTSTAGTKTFTTAASSGALTSAADPMTPHAATDTLELKKTQSRQPSEVWKYFTKKSDATASCTFCPKQIKHCRNTSNLMQHLTRKHKLLFAVPGQNRHATSESDSESVDDPVAIKRPKLQEKEKLCRIDEAFNRVTSFMDGGETFDRITNAILYMVAVDEMPLSTVERSGFKYLMKTVTPLYTVPSRKTITKLLDDRYEILKKRYVNNLKTVASYTLTCDNWTDISNQSYLGVSIHYLGEDCVLKSGVLGVFPLDDNHTAQYLAETLSFVIEDFALDRSKIAAVISDSAANIKKAICDTMGADKHLACVAHSLSHLVPRALKDLCAANTIITKVKDIVTLVRRSVVASDELKRLQIRDGKTEGTALKLCQDVTTRWNSTLYMLERFLLLEEYMYPVTSKCPKAPDMLTREEINILKELVSIMKPIEAVISEISGDSYPTCSVIIPIIHCLEASISSCEPQTPVGLELKRRLEAEIGSRFANFELHPILAKSTLLDPRFKKIHFQNIIAVSKGIQRINTLVQGAADQKTLPDNTMKSKPDDGKSIWGFHDKKVAENNNPDSTDQDLTLEIKQYLSQPVIPRTENPFKHWKTIQHAFPSLYNIAMQATSIVGTSVPSERLFSHAGLIKSESRNRLTGERLNKLCFLSALTLEEWGLTEFR